jgi:serine/threonine protein kinase
MGVVYLAYNRLLARQEVLKVLNKELIERGGGKARFLREMQSAARLSHPNIITAYSALQVGEVLVFAMEYVEGEDLDKLVKDRLEDGHGPLPVLNACYYVHQAALGLQHAFEKNMVHRDIKPQNLILARDSRKHVVKILDFGLAKVRRGKGQDAGLTATGEMLGTPAYVAPEQTVDAAHADIRADIYSLGCTLYHLLTGHPPFRGGVYEVLQAHHSMEAQPLHLIRPDVPEALAAVVKKMMAKDPADRYQTPVEVAQALAPFVKAIMKEAARPLSEQPEETPGEEKQRRAGSKPGVERGDKKSRATREHSAVDTGIPMAWETLTESKISSRKPAARRRWQSPAAMAAMKKKWLVGVSAATCLVLMGLVVLWASGLLKVRTKDGTIELRNLSHDADVLVDGDKATIQWGSDGKTAEIAVRPGTHEVVAKVNGIEVIGQTVKIKEGGQDVLVAKVVPLHDDKGDAPLDKKQPDVPLPQRGGRTTRFAADEGDPYTGGREFNSFPAASHERS